MVSGAIFGEIFCRFHLVSYACGGLILLSLAARAVLGPRPRRFAARFGLAALMLAATLYSGLIISESIERVQHAIGVGVAPSSLPAGDPRRTEFGRLHAQSSMIQLVPLIGGVILMLFELGDEREGRRAFHQDRNRHRAGPGTRPRRSDPPPRR